MEEKILVADDILAPDEAFHFARAVISRKPQHLMHNHDYYELFWLHHGKARHRINDQSVNLSEGDLVFIRPGDRHSIQGRGDETHLVNVIFRRAHIEALNQRHALAGIGFGFDGDLPDQVHRNTRQLADLSRAALRLEAGPRTMLAAEAFLLPLLSELCTANEGLHADLPDWLRRAIQETQQPEVFRDGAAGLVRVSGRGHAHVSRTMQSRMAMTPSEYVNRIRLAHAARALVGSSDSVAEIAEDCGIANLSHFHRLFRQHYGETPSAYRRQHQKSVIQPI